jgi:deoxycytidylate deaminase
MKSPNLIGGLYWANDHNCLRDYELGYDTNVKIKAELVEEALQLLRDNGWSCPEDKSNSELAKEMLFGKHPFLEKSRLYDVIEFGRAVHAEMDAISQAARFGIPLQNARLFCTTFPCHICARHIIATGISEVIFIEPYEKSRTSELYSDSISIEPPELSRERANFRAFVGVAPRRYMHLFQMKTSRKNSDGNLRTQQPEDLKPKFQRFNFAYIFTEIYFENEYLNLLTKEST